MQSVAHHRRIWRIQERNFVFFNRGEVGEPVINIGVPWRKLRIWSVVDFHWLSCDCLNGWAVARQGEIVPSSYWVVML